MEDAFALNDASCISQMLEKSLADLNPILEPG